MSDSKVEYHFFSFDRKHILNEFSKERARDVLSRMLTIRQFEARAEAAYQQGHIGGFFHAYTGQEAIQTAATEALGPDNWYTTTYRCHALALLTGVTPNEAMAELFGKANGNARGRGGSMHLYSDRMTGGYGIVGGHVPVATGCGFSLKYQKKPGVSICFIGDGAMAQGAVHESLNLASLWNLPCIYVVENNQWGMGTAVNRAICKQPIAESLAPAYDMESITLDGMDYFSCYAGFSYAYEKVQRTQRPIIIETVGERFKGHSISDPGLYRTKDNLQKAVEKDPILKFKQVMVESNFLTEQDYESLNEEKKELIKEAVKHAEQSPDPAIESLEEDVFAP